MCIRDSAGSGDRRRRAAAHLHRVPSRARGGRTYRAHVAPCLLYTSDAADERSSVDLGGRRIIKKKNVKGQYSGTNCTQHNRNELPQHIQETET